MDRRSFLKTAVAAASIVPFGSSFWRALGSTSSFVPGPGPYGPLGAPDANGISLPPGFTARRIARSLDPVGSTGYRWHAKPDGGATFATQDGGWIYVCNSEVESRQGGAGAMRFAADGTIVAAYPILTRTNTNCAGGKTPWGTWLSCEEEPAGQVWECDPFGVEQALPRPALGWFQHEAAVVDPATSQVYMTEDRSDGRFYRFTPDPSTRIDLPVEHPFPSPLLELGTLEVARLEADGSVTWLEVPVPNPPADNTTSNEVMPTRAQVPGSTAFQRGEGAWFAAGVVYFTTTTDHRIWAYDTATSDTATGRLEVIYDGIATPAAALKRPDNITVAGSGDLYVCEDADDLQIVLLSSDGEVAPFLQVSGSVHAGSELAGVAFNPAGDRLYFSSQRAFGLGATYEVAGPFRTAG